MPPHRLGPQTEWKRESELNTSINVSSASWLWVKHDQLPQAPAARLPSHNGLCPHTANPNKPLHCFCSLKSNNAAPLSICSINEKDFSLVFNLVVLRVEPWATCMGGKGSAMEPHPSSLLTFNEHSPNDCVPGDPATLLPVYWKNFVLDIQGPSWKVCPTDAFQRKMGNKLNVQQQQIG